MNSKKTKFCLFNVGMNIRMTLLLIDWGKSKIFIFLLGNRFDWLPENTRSLVHTRTRTLARFPLDNNKQPGKQKWSSKTWKEKQEQTSSTSRTHLLIQIISREFLSNTQWLTNWHNLLSRWWLFLGNRREIWMIH